MIKNTRCTLSGSRLASLCGVSQGTVDRALHGRKDISPATRERILRIARQYGFIAEEGSHSPEKPKGIIGIVVFDLENEYFSDLISGIEKQARKAGYAICIMLSHRDPKTELSCIESLYQMGAVGVILCPVGGAKGSNDLDVYLRYISSLTIPVVTVGNRIESIPHVGIDDLAAMEEVVGYLTGKGYARLIYVYNIEEPSNVNASAQQMRRDGFIRAAKELLPTGEFIICRTSEVPGLIESTGKKTAIICPSDIVAIRLYEVAKKVGAGIIGFDNISVIEELKLPLDSVAYDIEKSAGAALAAVLCKEENKVQATIPHKLISRGSTGSPNSTMCSRGSVRPSDAEHTAET